MSAGDPESWARLRLAQGESTALTLELTSSLGATTLTVGQSPGCDWIVREAGVAPVHFSLHWDGSVLRIADVYGAGGVRADGVLTGAQWRALTGRVRVDFGKAAIIVETGSAHAGGPANDPTPLPPISSEPKRGSARPLAKATLLGVAPIDASTLPPHMRGAVAQDEAEVGVARSHKPTLLGISDAPPPPVSPSTAPRAPGSIPPGKVPASAPPPNATLMGIGLNPNLGVGAGRRVGGGSLGDEDQRTIQGFPQNAQRAGAPSIPAGAEPREQRSTQQGSPSGSPPPGRGEEAIRVPTGTPAGSQRPAAPRAAAPQAAGPRGVGWHETPGEYEPSPARQPVPQAVLVDEPRRYEDPRRAAPNRHAEGVPGTREPGSMDSRRPKSRIPWRYLGVGALTAVAYFAWLYLLDHL